MIPVVRETCFYCMLYLRNGEKINGVYWSSHSTLSRCPFHHKSITSARHRAVNEALNDILCKEGEFR